MNVTLIFRRLVVLVLVAGLVAPAGIGGVAGAEVDTITSVDVQTTGTGSNPGLEVSVTADTSLDDTDIYGQDPGEPYFVILVDGTAIGRTGQVTRSETYSSTFTVGTDHLSGLSAGTHTVTVQLWDKDSDDFDPEASGDDDFLSEQSGTFSLSEPADLSLVASRSTVPVGGTLSVRAEGDTGTQPDWEIAKAPAGSDATLRTHNRQTVTFRPDEAGSYTIQASASGTDASGQVTIQTAGTAKLNLLRTYAPRIHYDAEELYRPTRYEAFVKHARLEDFGQADTNQPTMFDLADRSDAWELDLRGSESDFPSYDDQYPPTVYGSVHESVQFRGERYTAVTYWLFYIYDPKNPEGISQLIAHQSDLETVTILLQDGEPKWVGASQHHGGELREWSKTPKQGSHIDIYPAVGAHSNYFRNTEKFGGEGIPGQNQFVFASSMTTTLFNAGYADHTGNDRSLTATGEGDGRYQVVPLTGSEIWATYDGAFGPNDNEGKVPMQRDRWAQPGAWMESHLPADEKQVGGTITTTSFEMGDTGPLTANVQLRNPGPKPHTLWVILETKPASASWDGTQNQVVTTERVPLGVEQQTAVSLSGSPHGDSSQFDARVRVAAYGPTVLEEADVFATAVASTTFVRSVTATPTIDQTDTPTSSESSERSTSTGASEPTPTQPASETDALTDATPGASGPGFGWLAPLTAMSLLLGASLRPRCKSS